VKLPQDIPPEVMAFLQQVGYLGEDRLKPGDSVPELTLSHLADGATVTIGGSMERPVVLIFASYT
jgi:hypothetical protein